MIEKSIFFIIWNICAMIVFYAIIDDDTKPLKRIGYILFSLAFAFLFAPFEIARAINKINNSKTKENESK